MADAPMKTVRMSSVHDMPAEEDDDNELPPPGVGGGAEHKVRPISKHLAGNKEQPYDYVRMLYRGMDQGVTATSETQEQRVARSKQCRTTGWQSRFAVPYRALGTPDLDLPSKKGASSGEDLLLEERGATGGAHGHGGLTAREMRQLENGVTPAGRPLNWLPEAQRTMVYFGEAAKRNRRAHRSVLLAQLSASENRVKCVRAGQMATTVLTNDRLGSARGSIASEDAPPHERCEDGGSTFLTSVPGEPAGEPPSLQMPSTGRRRPNHVPQLRLGTSTTAVDDLAPNRSSTARLPSSAAGGGATARSGAATERTRPPPTEQGPEGGGASSRQRQARAEAISGNISMVHPVPPLKLVAENFQHEVDTLTDHMRTELAVKTSERLDTFRRKFKNFELGDLVFTYIQKTCIYVYMYIHSYMYVYVYVSIHVYTYVYVYVCIYIYI